LAGYEQFAFSQYFGWSRTDEFLFGYSHALLSFSLNPPICICIFVLIEILDEVRMTG
jgi:hypothetical protein